MQVRLNDRSPAGCASGAPSNKTAAPLARHPTRRSHLWHVIQNDVIVWPRCVLLGQRRGAPLKGVRQRALIAHIHAAREPRSWDDLGRMVHGTCGEREKAARSSQVRHEKGTKLSQDHHKTVTRWSQDGHKMVTSWSQDGHKKVTSWSQDGHKMVTRYTIVTRVSHVPHQRVTSPSQRQQNIST